MKTGLEIEYAITIYYDSSNDASIVDVKDWTVNFYVSSVEDAHAVAKLGKFEHYGIKALMPTNGDRGDLEVRVFVTPEVLEWEARVQSQRNAAKERRLKVFKAINDLPKTVTLYDGEGILITASRNNEVDDPHSLGVQYRLDYSSVFGHHSDYISGNGSRWSKYRLKRKNFVNKIYAHFNPEKKMECRFSFNQRIKENEGESLKKYGAILDVIVSKLKEYNQKIEDIKKGL